MLQRETNRYLDSTKAGRFIITYVLAVIRSLKASLSVGKRRPGWFFGLNDQGEIMSFTLTSGNTDDRAVVEKTDSIFDRPSIRRSVVYKQKH
ncbi:MAG: Putative transposase [Candidatus Midichloria mitochondrii]|nr:transposase [Candidatus Midichloria mitochondrii]